MSHRKPESSNWGPVVTAYAAALHRAGASTVTIETDVDRVFGARGVEATVMATPTALWVDVDGAARVLRVVPTSPDLARQVETYRIGERIVGGLDPRRAIVELTALDDIVPPWSTAATSTAFGLSAAAMAALLGGSSADVVAAVLLGLVAAYVEGLLSRRAGTAPLATFGAALLASLGARLLPTVDPGLASFAAIVAFAPGLMMTLAVTEITAGHWSAGTARLVGAGAVLLQLAAGLAVPPAAVPVVWAAPTVALPDAAWWVAVLAAPVALGVLFRLRPADLPRAMAVAAVVAAITWVAPSGAGVFAAAAIATVLANGMALRAGLPPLVLAVPAITLLVPGSVGVRGVGQILGDVPAGVDTMLGAVGVAAAIAAGLLVGQAIPLGGVRTRPSHHAKLMGGRDSPAAGVRGLPDPARITAARWTATG